MESPLFSANGLPAAFTLPNPPSSRPQTTRNKCTLFMNRKAGACGKQPPVESRKSRHKKAPASEDTRVTSIKECSGRWSGQGRQLILAARGGNEISDGLVRPLFWSLRRVHPIRASNVQRTLVLVSCHKQRKQPIPFWRLANALKEFHGGGDEGGYFVGLPLSLSKFGKAPFNSASLASVTLVPNKESASSLCNLATSLRPASVIWV